MQVITSAQRLHNAKTGVAPVSFCIGYYVMVHPVRPGSHKLNVGWTVLLSGFDRLPDLVFVVENQRGMQRERVQAQRSLPYPALWSADKLSREVLEYANYLDNSMQLIKSLHSICIRSGDY